MVELCFSIMRAMFWMCAALTAWLVDLITDLSGNRDNGTYANRPAHYEETPEQLIARHQWAVRKLQADHQRALYDIYNAATPRPPQ